MTTSRKDGAKNLKLISPAFWRGELDCVVGPFTSRDVARRFAGFGEDFGHFDVCERVFSLGDSWYVDVTALAQRPGS